MSSKSKPGRNAFDTFYACNSPAHAVALAYADHQAYNKGRGIPEFLDALRKAEIMLVIYDDLVAALKNIAAIPNEDFGCDHDEIDRARLYARNALTKAGAE